MAEILLYKSTEFTANYIYNHLQSLGFSAFLKQSDSSEDSFYFRVNLNGWGNPLVTIRVSDHFQTDANKVKHPVDYDIYGVRQRPALEMNDFFIKLSFKYNIPLPKEVQYLKNLHDAIFKGHQCQESVDQREKSYFSLR